ncbi:unnamed protein product [Dovyalis caffra]|uniref:Transmembrane protein n=1 Tax=Dovyalis caffra TaxID=77055 RepID=A0AAV1RQT4_9ROSI|nr:unnamed protein product [Dovyalis caffra]
MARSLLALSMQNHSFLSSIPVSYFFAFVAVLSVFSLVTFLCASHRKAKKSHRLKDEESLTSRSSEKKLLSKLNSDIRERAHSMVKMISWRKLQVQDEDFDDDDDDGSEEIWRRSIIMGERCRPLDFSGKIMYDCEGNLISDSTQTDKTEKIDRLEKSMNTRYKVNAKRQEICT